MRGTARHLFQILLICIFKKEFPENGVYNKTINYINNLSDKIQLSEKIQKIDGNALLQEFKDTDFMVTEL